LTIRQFDYSVEKHSASQPSENLRNEWLSYTPTTLTIQPGGNAIVTVSVDAATLAFGDYSDVINVISNDPENSNLTVPITMSVTATPLVADFSADQTNICLGDSIHFTDLSTGNTTQWQWDFQNDGTIDSYEQNPTWNYYDPGLYTVSLTVSDGTNADEELKEDYINVQSQTPSDTLVWVKSEYNPILEASSGGWEQYYTNSFCIEDENEYKLYYTAMQPNWMEVGLATSSDGISWTKCPSNPVLPRNVQSWSSFRIIIGSILRVNGTYYAFYIGNNQNLYAISSIGLATSTDGVNWTQYSDNPVIPYTSVPPGNATLSKPNVIYKNGLFHMYFLGDGNWHYATSSDGINWNIDNNPDLDLPYAGYSIRYDGLLHYALKGEADGDSVGFWTSLDGMNWTKKPESSLLPHQSWQTTSYGTGQGYFSLLVDSEINELRLFFCSAEGAWGQKKMGFAIAENIYANNLNADFSATPLSGIAPLTVNFTDLSTDGLDLLCSEVKDTNRPSKARNEKMIDTENSRDIISWEWDFQNDSTIDSYEQNPEWTYTEAGTYTVSLTVTDGTNSDTETKVDYIVVLPSGINFIHIYPGNGYNNMTFFVNSATIDGLNMESGDEIGIFDGDICVGAGVLISEIPPIFQMVASADDPTTGEIDGFTDGNPIIYRLWDASEIIEITYVLPTYTLGDGTFSQLGTAMVELEGFGYVEQTIGLLTGWNMLSFYNEPDNMDMMAIMQTLIDAGELFKVQDEGGLALVELPPPIGWYNGIGDMATTEGYYIKVLANTQLYTIGSLAALPKDIPLIAGWNMMSYPVMNPQDGLAVVQPLIDTGDLFKVQNEAGLAIVYLPGIGWYNGIGDFLPGEGYYIKVNSDVTLTIYEPVDYVMKKRESINKVKNQTPQLRETTHFIPNWNNNPYMAMNVFVTSLEIEGLSIESGDELSIFDGELCVGSTYIEDDELISLIASTDDPTTEEIDGFTEDNEMSFRFWDSIDNIEIELTITEISGDEIFTSLGTSVLCLEIMTTGISDDPIPAVTKLDSNYPNPFNPSTTINFSIKESGHVTLEIYNIKGQKVKTLVNDVKNAGYHSAVWDGTDDNRNPVSSGIYLYKMNEGNQIMLKKMLLVK